MGAAILGVAAPAHAQFDRGAPQFARAADVQEFYARRGGEPLWFSRDGNGEAAATLLTYLRSAEIDGADPRNYPVFQIERAMQAAWGGNMRAMQDADRLLSEAFVAYVSDLKRAPSLKIDWVDQDLRPAAGSALDILGQAAAAPSIDTYVASMGWMNPVYGQLRAAIVQGRALSAAEEQLLTLNLERARALPAGGRYVLVNAAEAKLTMVEDGRAVDSMKVVVGKPAQPTPMMAAHIRFTSLNPYWNVPADLAAERIAPHVVKSGLGYLKANGYQVLSNWSENATVVDPATIDWQAVADRKVEVRIRQLPGRNNAMGKMKFMFPNAEGIYLHDTPQRELLTEASRLFSGGCVRLEDAPRLARWLFGKPLATTSTQPELRVDLPRPVPVFITYLTVVPDGSGSLAFLPDVYGRDAQALAGTPAGPDFATR